MTLGPGGKRKRKADRKSDRSTSTQDDTTSDHLDDGDLQDPLAQPIETTQTTTTTGGGDDGSDDDDAVPTDDTPELDKTSDDGPSDEPSGDDPKGGGGGGDTPSGSNGSDPSKSGKGLTGDNKQGTVQGGGDGIEIKESDSKGDGGGTKTVTGSGDEGSKSSGDGETSSGLSLSSIPSPGPAPIPDLAGDGGLLLGDPSVDGMLLKQTGLSTQGHRDLLTLHTTDLSASVTQANTLIQETGQGLQSVNLSFGGGLTSQLGTLKTSSTGTLTDQFSSVRSQVDSSISTALGTVGTQISSGKGQMSSVGSTQVSKEQAAFDSAKTLLQDSKSKWEGDYTSTLLAQAAKVRALGESYEQIAKAKEADSRAKFKSLGATSNPDNALELAYHRAAADTYKTYAPEFKKYGEHAAKFLEGMAQQSTALTDKLLAPTLDSLYPLQQDNKQTLTQDTGKLDTQLTQEGQSFQKSMTSLRTDQLQSLDTAGKDAITEVDTATSNLQFSTDRSLRAIGDHESTVIGQMQTSRLRYITELDGVQSQLSGTTDATVFEAGKQELMCKLDDDTSKIVSTLKTDSLAHRGFVLDKHKTQTGVIKTQTDQHAKRVQQAGTKSLDSVKLAQDNTQTQLSTLMTTGNTIYSTVGTKTVQTAQDNTKQVDTTSTEYRQKLTKQMDDYTNDAVLKLNDLLSKAMVAADTAGKTAKLTQATALKDRAKTIYKAIDGWGTDESTLLKQMSGLTKAEAKYTAARYHDLAGESLRSAIIGDTSEGDNVRTACLAYLNGNQTEGAKYALKYASEGLIRVFGADMDLVNHTLSNMNEESRTALLADPDFPQIKQNIENPTINMSSAMMLGPLAGTMPMMGVAFFGPKKYDLDAFSALSDPTKTLEEAKKDVQVIELARAFDTDSMNPFKWGTDEAQVFAILGKLEGEELEAFKAKFKAYKGVSLEAEIADEFKGAFEDPLEYKRAMALARGDKAAADAYALEKSLKGGKEQEVFGLLEDPALVAANKGTSNDWLADRKALGKREQLNSSYESQTGSTLATDIKTNLTGEGEHAEDIALSHLKGETADPKHLLAYAIIRGGTDEAYAQKAIKQLLSDVQAKKAENPLAGKQAWDDLKSWFATNYGINDLEKYLGVGGDEGLYDPALRELDGQERQDFDDILKQVVAEPDNVNDEYARVKSKWEWYRGKGAGVVGNGITDLYSDSGGDLDAKMDHLKDMMADVSWYNAKTGKPHDLKGARYDEFKKYVELLDTMGGIYKDQRDALTDAICTVITTIAAIVSTIVTFGALGPVWVAVAIGAGAALVNMAIKSSMKGSSYGTGEALTDFAQVAGQALVGMVTAGIGPAKFQQFGKFLQSMADKSLKMKVLSNVISGVPGEIQSLLFNEKTWTGDWDEFVALLGVSSFQLTVSALGGVATDSAASKVADPGKKWVNALGETITEIVSDPVVMSGDDIHMALLTKSIEKFGGAMGAEVSIRNKVNKYNKMQSIPDSDVPYLGNITDDAAADLVSRLNPQHQLQLHQEHPTKYAKPDFDGVQLDLFDATKAVVLDSGDKVVEQVPSKTNKDVVDPDQLTLDFDGTQNPQKQDQGVDHVALNQDKLPGEQMVLFDTKGLPHTDPVDDKVVVKPSTKNDDQLTLDFNDEKLPAPVKSDDKVETVVKTDDKVSVDKPLKDDGKTGGDKSVETLVEHIKTKDNKPDVLPGPLTHMGDPTLVMALQDIDRIGPILSQKVIDARELGGPFKDAADLQKRVVGIGPILSERIIANIKGRTELHNHQNGVFEVTDLLELYTSGGDKGNLQLVEQISSNRHKLDAQIDKAKAAAAKATGDEKIRLQGEVAKAEQTLAVVNTLLEEHSQATTALERDQVLKQLLNAGTLNYDQAYQVRKLLGGMHLEGGAAKYYEVLLTRLAVQGITYIELTGGQNHITPEDMRAIMDKTGVEIRFLKSVRSRQTLGHETEAEAEARIRKEMERAFGDGSEGKHFVGIDYLGAEPEFKREGMKAFETTCKALHDQLDDGQKAVVRVHVGEGYFSDDMSPDARKLEAQKAQDNVGALIESITNIQAEIGADSGVQIRAGHVTHATDAQLQQLKSLGVHVEVNLGSNLKTQAVQDLESHPLLKMLYYDMEMSINTDAGGMMSTNLDKEYDFAATLIEQFTSGDVDIKLDDGTVLSYADMDKKQKDRFDVQYLEKMSREYQEDKTIGRDN